MAVAAGTSVAGASDGAGSAAQMASGAARQEPLWWRDGGFFMVAAASSAVRGGGGPSLGIVPGRRIQACCVDNVMDNVVLAGTLKMKCARLPMAYEN